MPLTLTEPVPGHQHHEAARSRTERRRSVLVLVGLVVVTEAIGGLGATVTDTGPESWYRSIDKPWFNPPSWVFAPVWTTLYAVIAVAAWLVWRAPSSAPGRTNALRWWSGQLVLNGLWTPVFFGLERPALALVVIMAMVAATVMAILRFRLIDRRSGALMVPYLVWISFATVLNLAIVLAN